MERSDEAIPFGTIGNISLPKGKEENAPFSEIESV